MKICLAGATVAKPFFGSEEPVRNNEWDGHHDGEQRRDCDAGHLEGDELVAHPDLDVLCDPLEELLRLTFSRFRLPCKILYRSLSLTAVLRLVD